MTTEPAVDLDRGTERVSQILHSQQSETSTQETRTRKQRSDVGKPRAPKPPEAPGQLTKAQIDKLRDLIEAKEEAIQENTRAESNMLDASSRLAEYLESLTARNGKE